MEDLNMFHLTTEELTEKKALHTTREIYQQPSVWEELAGDFIDKQENLKSFLNSIFTKHERTRVIFTGAGTSAFIGDILVPELSKQQLSHVQFESIPTTDIVSNPTEYFFENSPTILVSFARSGNSPESVATVALGQELIEDFYQVVITCNKEGVLARNIQKDENSIVILTPERANDQSLAMTSSFSSMMVAAYALFTESHFTTQASQLLASTGKKFFDSFSDKVKEIMQFDFNRIVYLGSGLLAQLSHEAALKMLELTAGNVVALHESSLGFRHGPKSILHDQSLVVLFMSQDDYTRKYDLDILRELASAKSGMKIVALTEEEDEEVANLADWSIVVNPSSEGLKSDLQLGLIYILFAQSLALNKSVQLGISPDNPSPDGAISRVVQGVTIHDYKK